MAILVAVMAVVGVNATKMMQKERFRSSTTLIADKLKFAQDLMLILQTDVSIKFEQTEKGNWLCKFTTAKSLNKALKRIANDNIAINGIDKIVFEEAETHLKKESPIEITFYAGGAAMAHGSLKLYGGKGTLEEQIYLPGYPAPIAKGPKDKDFNNNDHNILNNLYPKEIKALLEEETNVSPS